MTASAPLTLSLSSQLIQDYLYLDEPPPPVLAERDSLVAIEGGLLAINGATVTHYELEPASEGGWRTSTITVPTPATAANSTIMTIKAFTINGNKDGGTPTSTLNLLCFFAADGWAEGGGTQAAYAVSWLVREAGGTWQGAALSTEAVGLLSQVQSLEVFDAGSGKGIFVYGLTTSMFGQTNAQLFVLKIWNYNDITTAPWSIASQRTVPDWPAARFLFLASGDAGAARPVSLCLTVPMQSGTTVLWSTPLPVAEETGPDLSNIQWAGQDQIPGTLQEFLPLNGLAQWTALAVDNAGLVYRLGLPSVSGQGCNQVVLNQGVGPSNVTAVSVTRRIGQSMSMFAVGDGRLWLTRDIQNVDWVGLGDPVAQLATPGYDPTVFELFYADPTATQANRIYHLSQDTANSVWTRQVLATLKDPAFTPGAAGPAEVGTISIELSATHQDTRGPTQTALVNVTSDQWVVLLADKRSYWVGPGQDQQIPADQLGLVTIRYHARDLKLPHLTFYATEQGRPNSPTVGCHGDAIDADPNPSNSIIANRLAGNGDDGHFQMNTAAMQSAQLLPGSGQDDKTTDCLKQLGGFMLSCHARQSAAGSAGSAMDSTSDDAGDVLNWIKHTAEHMGEFAVTITGDVATLTIGAYTVVVKTARQAGDAIGTILAKAMAGLRELEDVLKDLIEFLKILFEWKDILQTHQALKTLLSWGVNFIPANIGAVNAWVDQHLDGLEEKIDSAISQAESCLQKNDVTANRYAQDQNLTTPGQSQPLLSGTVYQIHLTHHKSRCHYVMSRARPHVGAMTSAAGNNASIDDAMNASFATPCIAGQKATFLPAIQSILSPDGVIDVKALFDSSALALLRLSKDLIAASVEGLEAVVKAVLETIASAATWFAESLSKPLDIPVISWLYSALVEDTPFPACNELSPLDLFCFILAVPVTVLYKVIRGGEAPFGGSRMAAMTAAFSVPANTNFAALADFGSNSTIGAAAVPGLDTASEVLGVVSGCLGLFSGFVGGIADFIALTNQFIDDPDLIPYQPLVSWVSWGLSSLSTLCEAPLETFASFDTGSVEPVAVAKTVLFALEALPNVGDLIVLCASKTSLMKMVPNGGPYWDGACGFAIYGAAISYVILAALKHEDGAWDYINPLISNINRPFRVTMPWVGDGDIVAYAAVLALIEGLDIDATVGGVATEIGSSVRG